MLQSNHCIDAFEQSLKLRFQVCLFFIKLGHRLLYVMQLVLKVLSEVLTFSQLHVHLSLGCSKRWKILLLHLHNQVPLQVRRSTLQYITLQLQAGT